MSRPFFRLSSVLLLLSCCAFALTAIGCNGNKKPESSNTITFWHFWSEPAQKQALLARIAEFEKENPDYHVELSELSWNDGKTKLLAAFNSNTAPDVLELGSDWIAQFSSAGVLADQSKMAGDSAPRFASTILAPGKWKDGIFAWPWVIDTRVLFINKGILAASGIDSSVTDTLWEQVIVDAEKVRATHPDMYGFGVNGPDPHRLYKKILPFFWSNGGELLDASGKPVVNSPQNVAALETYLELARTGLIETQKQLDQMFIQNKIAFLISGSWLADRIAKDNPDLHYGVSVMPSFPGGSPVSFAGGEYLAINAASQQQIAAKRLVTFLTSGKQALEFCKTLPGGMVPADRSGTTDPFFESPTRKVFTRQLLTARMTPVHPKWLDIEEVIEDEVSQALLGSKTAQQALDNAQGRIALLARGNAPAAGDEVGQ